MLRQGQQDESVAAEVAGRRVQEHHQRSIIPLASKQPNTCSQQRPVSDQREQQQLIPTDALAAARQLTDFLRPESLDDEEADQELVQEGGQITEVAIAATGGQVLSSGCVRSELHLRPRNRHDLSEPRASTTSMMILYLLIVCQTNIQ